MSCYGSGALAFASQHCPKSNKMTTYLVTICSLSLISLDNLINPGNAYECPKHVTEALWQPPSTDDYRGPVDESIGFQYKDPKTYKGPVVPGWEPGKS